MVSRLEKQNVKKINLKAIYTMIICKGKRTEWSTIQGVIGRIISNRPSA